MRFDFEREVLNHFEVEDSTPAVTNKLRVTS